MPEDRTISNLISDKEIHDLRPYFPDEYDLYSKTLALLCYDPKEILVEKVRAIMTRMGTKARDFLDIYVISKKFKIDLQSLNKEITEKMSFSLDVYEKYRSNFKKKRDLLEQGQLFDWGAEKELLISEIDEEDFYDYVKRLLDYLTETMNVFDI